MIHHRPMEEVHKGTLIAAALPHMRRWYWAPGLISTNLDAAHQFEAGTSWTSSSLCLRDVLQYGMTPSRSGSL